MGPTMRNVISVRNKNISKACTPLSKTFSTSNDTNMITTNEDQSYSYIQSRHEFRTEITSLRKKFMAEVKYRNEKLARDAEAQRAKVMKAKAERLVIKRQKQAIRAAEVAEEKRIHDETYAKYFQEKIIIRQERLEDMNQRCDAIIDALKTQSTEWITKDNYKEKIKDDLFVYSPLGHRTFIGNRYAGNNSSNVGSGMSWLELLQRIKPEDDMEDEDESEDHDEKKEPRFETSEWLQKLKHMKSAEEWKTEAKAKELAAKKEDNDIMDESSDSDYDSDSSGDDKPKKED